MRLEALAALTLTASCGTLTTEAAGGSNFGADVDADGASHVADGASHDGDGASHDGNSASHDGDGAMGDSAIAAPSVCVWAPVEIWHELIRWSLE
jgi:hypothetical protein